MSDKIPVKNLPGDKDASFDLYAKRKDIQVRYYQGLFKNLRVAGVAILFLLYFGVAWIDWDGRQAILWDLPARQFHIFSATFQPQDFFLLSFLLIICAFGLFFITVFAGRVWCGYACPQTVWTFLYMWVERITEGERNARVKLNKAAWTGNKLLRKAAKHTIWISIGLLTGITFVGYFTPIRGLMVELVTFSANGWAVFWIFFFTVATYLNAGLLREQVCIYMCPYARFQSVMFDRDTLIVSYDAKRGDPRGSRRKDADPKTNGLGDCIDCNICVQVCPTGIDIRDGLQYECIGCAACVDACDEVMDKMNYPRGLIRYTTENNLEGGKTHILRPRLLGYGLALLVMVGFFVVSLSNLAQVGLDVQRDRNVLFREVRGGNIENVYIVRIHNKTRETQRFNLSVEGHPQMSLHVPAGELAVDPNSLLQVPVNVQLDPGYLESTNMTITFRIEGQDNIELSASAESRFMGPRVR